MSDMFASKDYQRLTTYSYFSIHTLLSFAETEAIGSPTKRKAWIGTKSLKKYQWNNQNSWQNMPGFIFVSTSLEGTVTWSASGHNTKWLSEYFKQKHQIFPLKLMAHFADRQRFCSNQKKRIFTRKWSYSLQSGN